jgi:transcriptional regulator with XRE-family HTH domain
MTNKHKEQQKSCELSEEFERLDALRVRKGVTWDVIAGELGISKSMIFHVKRGSRNLGKKALYRLEQLEATEAAAAPAQSDAKQSQGKVAAEMLTAKMKASRIRVLARDIKWGYMEAPVEYLAGKPPKGCPSELRLQRPDVRVSARLLKEISGSTGGLEQVLKASLIEEFNSDGFLNQLTPFCYHALEEAAADLAFGLNWRGTCKNP